MNGCIGVCMHVYMHIYLCVGIYNTMIYRIHVLLIMHEWLRMYTLIAEYIRCNITLLYLYLHYMFLYICM